LSQSARLSQHLGGRGGELGAIGRVFRGQSPAVRELPGISRAFRG
jgi:hypothetical protein